MDLFMIFAVGALIVVAAALVVMLIIIATDKPPKPSKPTLPLPTQPLYTYEVREIKYEPEADAGFNDKSLYNGGMKITAHPAGKMTVPYLSVDCGNNHIGLHEKEAMLLASHIMAWLATLRDNKRHGVNNDR